MKQSWFFFKRKYLPSYFPFLVILLSFVFESFQALLGSIWFWSFNFVFYVYLFLDRHYSLNFRKQQQREVEEFTWPESDIDLKVLTYNIFLRPPFVKNNADDFKNERLQGFIDYVLSKHVYDIILLQEIFQLGNFRQRKLIKVARSHGYLFHARGVGIPIFSKKFVDAGLLILSKYPIVERDAHLYHNGNQIDSWAAKQAIYAKIQFNQTQFLHFFTTHMQASYFDSAEQQSKLSDQSRLGQVDELAEFVHSKIHDSPYPALIAGDLNIHARSSDDLDEESAEYKYLIAKVNEKERVGHLPVRNLLKEAYGGRHPNTYADICEKGKPREVVLTHTADLGTALSIDHCLFIDSVENKRTGAIKVNERQTKVEEFLVNPSAHPFTQLSDHYGISTSFKVSKIK